MLRSNPRSPVNPGHSPEGNFCSNCWHCSCSRRAGRTQAVFQQIRPKTGLAFVVIQHPAPDHKSIRNESLSLYTDMQIHIVRDGMEVESNMIYLMPPGKSLAVAQ